MNVKVEHYTIPWGNAGIRRTLRKMGQLARHDLSHPLLVQTTGRILADSTGPADQARRIREFLTVYVRFLPDPSGLELVRSPVFMLREIEAHGQTQGDCDDVATLGAAMGLAVDLPARFVVLSFKPHAPFSHVFTELATPAGWLELDTTAPDQFPAGLRVYDRQHFEV